MDQTEADPETTEPNIHQLIKSSTLHILPTLLVHKTAKKQTILHWKDTWKVAQTENLSLKQRYAPISSQERELMEETFRDNHCNKSERF